MAGNANRYALSANTEDTDKIPIEARGATKTINDLDKSKTLLVTIQQKIYNGLPKSCLLTSLDLNLLNSYSKRNNSIFAKSRFSLLDTDTIVSENASIE